MAFLYTWNPTFEGQPEDSENASLGASRIRALKGALSERLIVDHIWGVDATDGIHKQVTMGELATKPTVATNQGAFYVKAKGSTTVPYFEDDAGTEHELAAFNAAWPIGSVYISVVSTNPNTLFGYGTWTAFATGRTLVAIDTGNTLMDTVEETFGQADAVNVTHNHAITDPGHDHDANLFQSMGAIDGQDRFGAYTDNNSSGQATTLTNTTGITINNSGESGTNKNYQPSIVVYMWKRTA